MSEEALKPVRKRASLAWVSWVASFLSFYGSESLEGAGLTGNPTSKTIRDNVRALESWLHIPLMDESVIPRRPTQEADKFLPGALRIIELVEKDERLRADVKRLRVRPDGVCVIDGCIVRSTAAAEIGNILLAARANPEKGVPYVAPTPVDPRSIDMSNFVLSPEIADKLSIGKRLMEERASRRAGLYEIMSRILEQAVENERTDEPYMDRKSKRQELQSLIKAVGIVIAANG